VTTSSTDTRVDLSGAQRFIDSITSNLPSSVRTALQQAGGVRGMINVLPEPFKSQANALIRTTSETSTQTSRVPLEGEELDRAWQGFIDDMQRENDNFSPLNQIDLAAFQRVFQNDTLLQKSVSDIATTYHNTRKDIAANFKA
jgi:hypothetical protein